VLLPSFHDGVSPVVVRLVVGGMIRIGTGG